MERTRSRKSPMPRCKASPIGMTYWSCHLLAAALGVSKSTVITVLQSHNLKPHRVKKFKLSRDPRFLEKLTDGVGLYLIRGYLDAHRDEIGVADLDVAALSAGPVACSPTPEFVSFHPRTTRLPVVADSDPSGVRWPLGIGIHILFGSGYAGLGGQVEVTADVAYRRKQARRLHAQDDAACVRSFVLSNSHFSRCRAAAVSSARTTAWLSCP